MKKNDFLGYCRLATAAATFGVPMIVTLKELKQGKQNDEDLPSIAQQLDAREAVVNVYGIGFYEGAIRPQGIYPKTVAVILPLFR